MLDILYYFYITLSIILLLYYYNTTCFTNDILWYIYFQFRWGEANALYPASSQTSEGDVIYVNLVVIHFDGQTKDLLLKPTSVHSSSYLHHHFHVSQHYFFFICIQPQTLFFLKHGHPSCFSQDMAVHPVFFKTWPSILFSSKHGRPSCFPQNMAVHPVFLKTWPPILFFLKACPSILFFFITWPPILFFHNMAAHPVFSQSMSVHPIFLKTWPSILFFSKHSRPSSTHPHARAHCLLLEPLDLLLHLVSMSPFSTDSFTTFELYSRHSWLHRLIYPWQHFYLGHHYSLQYRITDLSSCKHSLSALEETCFNMLACRIS